jgi:protein-tyrosine phosphatase
MIKAALRELYWSLRGFGFRNPVLDRPVKRFVFICSGNICRSPFAEHYFREEGTGCEAISLGLDAEPGETPPPHVIEAASRFGIDLSEHRARRFEAELIAEEDLLLLVDLIHLRRLCRSHPDLRGRAWLLPMLDPVSPTAGEGSRYRIPDPYGADLEKAVARLGRVGRCVKKLTDMSPLQLSKP